MPSFMVINHVTDHVTNAGTKNVVSRKHVERLKSGCILANMGHSNQEIDMESIKELKLEKIRKHISHIHLTNGKRVVLLAEVGVGAGRGMGGEVGVRGGGMR